MAKYTRTETIWAEPWDGTEENAQHLMAELGYHGVTAHYHSGFLRATGPNSGVPVSQMISLPGYTIHPTDYLVKHVSSDGAIDWSVKSERQMSLYTEEKG